MSLAGIKGWLGLEFCALFWLFCDYCSIYSIFLSITLFFGLPAVLPLLGTGGGGGLRRVPDGGGGNLFGSFGIIVTSGIFSDYYFGAIYSSVFYFGGEKEVAGYLSSWIAGRFWIGTFLVTGCSTLVIWLGYEAWLSAIAWLTG